MDKQSKHFHYWSLFIHLLIIPVGIIAAGQGAASNLRNLAAGMPTLRRPFSPVVSWMPREMLPRPWPDYSRTISRSASPNLKMANIARKAVTTRGPSTNPKSPKYRTPPTTPRKIQKG